MILLDTCVLIDALTGPCRSAPALRKAFERGEAPRGRERDLAIAACALSWNASLWTLNLGDFADIPGLAAARPG